MKRLSLQFSALLTALFLFAFSCQDHYVPEEPEPETPAEAPVVQTLPITVENVNNNLYRYKINVEKLGNIKISGYGIVFSAEFNSNAPFTKMPTLADNKVTFPMSNGTGEKSKLDAAPPGGYKTMYYRAYVTYGVNSVAYGDVMEFSPVPLPQAKIVTNEVDLISSPNYRFSLTFDDLGEVAVAEFGIVLAFRDAEIDNDYNVNPDFLAFDRKVVFTSEAKLGQQSFDINIPESVGKYAMYYRAYAQLSNGSVVYGDVLDYD